MKLKFFFFVCWLLAACVSCYDTYLTIRLFEELSRNEQNPIAREILQVENWKTVSTFVSIKMGGTITSLHLATLLFSRNRKWGITVMMAVAAFQLWLLMYLTMV